MCKVLVDAIAADNAILMDGDCIYCRNFTDLMAVRTALGGLKVVNLRDRPDLVEAMRRCGMEPDEGMVFKHGQTIHFGPDAVSALASIASRTKHGPASIPLAILARAPIGRALYPIMRASRFATLKLRGLAPFGKK